MSDERRELIKRSLQSGNRYDDVRRELIVHGYSTEGYEEVYDSVMKELGINEPKLNTSSGSVFKNSASSLSVGPVDSEPKRKPPHKRMWRLFVEVIVVLIVAVLAAGMFRWYSGYQSQNALDNNDSQKEQSSDGLGFIDTITEAQMVSLQVSANQYKAKLFDYQGLCKSIGIPDDVSCSENIKEYSMESILSNGQFYCIDSVGYSGVTQTSKRGTFSCR